MKIIVIGDSNTKGEMLGSKNWTTLLSGLTGIEVVNEGVNGHTTEDARIRLTNGEINLNGDAVFIMFGTNDAVMTEKNKPKVSLSRYRENLLYFINLIRQTSKKPVLMTVIPLIEGSGGDGYYLSRHHTSFFKDISPRDWVDQYNDIVREISDTERVQLIDVWQYFLKKSGAEHDPDPDKYLIQSGMIDSSGTHLTAEGARELYTVVSHSLNAKKRI
ncbi:SGNH/GDSL hydrolase family protein [Jeotgalibacillus malaysiensis]|uniref:SGNH/GDSL hydrolase family protein n=1 Tax=Jeotgalibacillus malaysiensis TaxID=1508404 RepID=UPI00384FEDDF